MEALNRSFESTRAILAKVQPGNLDAATACASWDVSALVNHFVGTARWWAAIVTGAATLRLRPVACTSRSQILWMMPADSGPTP
jgi:Mycothiol maleylpyruvate isomerase N-terminal domain